MSELLVTEVKTAIWDETIEIQWSSSAEAPRFWLRIRGGESIDPRDPKGLARLPLTNTTLLGVKQAKALRAALDEWIERLESADPDHYFGEDDEDEDEDEDG